MKYKKLLAFFVVIFVVLVVVIVLVIRHVVRQQKYKPIINPHPHYFMTVSGHIDPSLSKHVKVNLVATYYTTNSKCEVTDNIYTYMEGVYFYRDHKLYFKVRPNNRGDFSEKIPLDRYKLGYCMWRVSDMEYHLKFYRYDDIDTINFFTHKDKNRVFNQTVEYVCNVKSCNLLTAPYLDETKILFDKNNYQFKIIIKRRDEK